MIRKLHTSAFVDTERFIVVGRGKHFWTVCDKCGEGRFLKISSWSSSTGRHRKCAGRTEKTRRPYVRGAKHANCKGDAKRNVHGYPLRLISLLSGSAWEFATAMVPNQYYILEHRLVMALQQGRPLRSDEIVHHIDGDKGNNTIDNLFLTDVHEHTGEHAKHLKRLMAEIVRLRERIRVLEEAHLIV